jgi:hypothetical protein
VLGNDETHRPFHLNLSIHILALRFSLGPHNFAAHAGSPLGLIGNIFSDLVEKRRTLGL